MAPSPLHMVLDEAILGTPIVRARDETKKPKFGAMAEAPTPKSLVATLTDVEINICDVDGETSRVSSTGAEHPLMLAPSAAGPSLGLSRQSRFGRFNRIIIETSPKTSADLVDQSPPGSPVGLYQALDSPCNSSKQAVEGSSTSSDRKWQFPDARLEVVPGLPGPPSGLGSWASLLEKSSESSEADRQSQCTDSKNSSEDEPAECLISGAQCHEDHPSNCQPMVSSEASKHDFDGGYIESSPITYRSGHEADPASGWAAFGA